MGPGYIPPAAGMQGKLIFEFGVCWQTESSPVYGRELQMLSLTRPNLVLVCGWPRCREYQSVIAWMVHAVLYCFVALDVIPLGPGCIPPAAGMQGKLMFEFGRLLLAD